MASGLWTGAKWNFWVAGAALCGRVAAAARLFPVGVDRWGSFSWCAEEVVLVVVGVHPKKAGVLETQGL